MIKKSILSHRKSQKKYKASIKGKITEKKYYQNNMEKRSAYDLVKIAKKNGKLVSKKCRVCGKSNTVAHHDDYTKPLKVVWFCDFHHSQYHKSRR